MRTIDGLIYIFSGFLLLFFLPTCSVIQKYNLIKYEKAEQIKKGFLEEIYECGEISEKSYLSAYEELYILKNKEMKIELLHLEGEKGAELSDYVYITGDEEIRNELETGAYKVPKGSVVRINE